MPSVDWRPCIEHDVWLENSKPTNFGKVWKISEATLDNIVNDMEADLEIVMVDGTLWDDSFEQDWSWDGSGTIISGI